MSTTQEKYKLLVERLYQRTLEKRVNWSISPYNAALEASIADKTVELSSGENQEGEPLVYFTIKDLSGNVVENFNDETISGISSIDPSKSYYQLMAATMSVAQRQATGADEAIDLILGELEDENPF